jgi:RHS repeat-associated protein
MVDTAGSEVCSGQGGLVVYGSYVDEVVAYTQTVAGVTKRYYPHNNHLYSVAALTDAAGQVVERFTYDAYGKQKITDASGNVIRSKSAVGWDRGFTGYVADNETGLAYARSRMYSPTLGRFASRDSYSKEGFKQMLRLNAVTPLKASQMALDVYRDGYCMYGAYFVPNGTDPYGLITKEEVEKLFKKEMEEALKRQKEREREQGGYIVKDGTGKYIWIVGDDKNNTETSAEMPPYYPDPNDPSKRSSDEEGKLEIVADWHTHPPVEGGCSREDKKGKDDERKKGFNVPVIVVYPLPGGFGVDSY